MKLDYQVHRLYFNEGKTQREIAEELEIKRHTIITMFKERGWEARPSAPRREEVHPDDVYKLYFQEGFSQKEVAEKLGLSSPSPVKRVFEENAWKPRGRWNKPVTRTHFSSDEERKEARKERSDKFQQELKEMRAQLFGTECKICGTNNEEKTIAIHRKDFKDHKQNALWLKNNLESIDPEDWAPLCIACHRGVHWLRERYNMDWSDIEQYLKRKRKMISQGPEPFVISKDTKRSQKYEETRESINELRKSLFGEVCSLCDDSTERRLVIHRKDGRSHSSSVLWSRGNLEALDPDEWAALCQKCHRYVHWAEDNLGLEWNDFENREN